MFLHHKLLRRSFCDTTSSTNCVKPWFFIGLGNPGEKDQSMRHNVGFDMIDAFAQAQDIPMTSIHFKALFGEGALSGMVGDTPVLLEKPQTYMNLSGQSTGPLAAYYKLPLNRIIVMYDDMDLPCGVLRVQPKGWKNVIYHFRGNWAFGRLRIGIGRPPVQMDPKAFQLQRFNTLARERIDVALQEWVNILKTLVAKSLTGCARSANADQKYKHLRLQNVPVEALKLYRPGKILGRWIICRPFCRQITDLNEGGCYNLNHAYLPSG